MPLQTLAVSHLARYANYYHYSLVSMQSMTKKYEPQNIFQLNILIINHGNRSTPFIFSISCLTNIDG